MIVEPLRTAGFEVDTPPHEEVAIVVRSGPCPDPGLELPPPEPERPTPRAARSLRGDGLTECLRFEADEPKPVASLAFSTQSPRRLVVELGSDRRGGPQKRPQVHELEQGRPIAELPARTRFGACGGLHFLPDGRLLYALYDFAEGSRSMVSLRVWREGAPDTPELATYVHSHVGDRCQTAVDAAFKTIAVATPAGIVLRGIGGPEAPLPAPRGPAPRVIIRKKNATPPAPGPWDELGKVGGDAVGAYPMLAMSPDGQHLLWTANGAHTAKLVSRADDRVRWTADVFPDHVGGRGLRGVLFSTSGEQLLAIVALSQHKAQPDGRIDFTTLWQTRVLRTADGARAWPELERALTGATCASFHPKRPELAAGFDDGRVRLFAFPNAEELASVTIERPGGVTAIAFDAQGAQLAVGTGAGEVLLFVRK